MLTVTKRIWLSFMLVLVVGCSLTMIIALSGQKVSEVTHDLVNNQIPRLALVQQMSSAVIEHERLLYEYYATTERNHLWPKILESEHLFLSALQSLKLNSEASISLLAEFNQLQNLRKKIDNNLGNRDIDWNLARDHLVQLTEMGKNAKLHLNVISQTIKSESLQVSNESQSRIQGMINMVAIFSFAVIGFSGLVGYITQINLRESANRKKLALFAERNPAAVVSLNWKGHIVYHNPACVTLLNRLALDESNISALLPDNFVNRLTHWQAEKEHHIEFEHTVLERTLKYHLSILPDLETCHLYIEDITDQKHIYDQLTFQVYHDQLTRLPNRRRFLEQVDTLINQQRPFSLLLISLDRFELVQSAQGYDIGDAIIIGMTQRLGEIIDEFSETIHLFRMEGTRFCLVLESKIKGSAEMLARSLQQRMDNPIEAEGHRYYFTTSIGICQYPTDAVTARDLVSNVNTALSQAKAVGDHYELFDPDVHSRKQSLLPMETALRNALKHNQFQLHYQGKVDATQQQVNGAEALIRWQDNEGKMISPAQFIPVAEQTGLIIKIGEWVIEQAFLQAARFAQEGIELQIAINISARQFQHRHFIAQLQSALERTGISPQLIELEITESLIMQNVDYSIATMKRLKELGFSLAIDDFGTGYSSLSYLKQFPIDTLKIDRAFIQNLEQDDKDKSIVRSIIDLSNHLHLKTVAEGVETEWQWRYLRDMGCHSIQGFYFGRPDTADRLSVVGKGHKKQA